MKRILLISLLLIAFILTVSADRRRLLGARNVAAAGSATPEFLWWKMNEGSGTTVGGSASAGGDGGTNNSSWVAGAAGNALSFNGTTHNASTTSAITMAANQATVTFWANCDATGTGRRFIETGTLWTSDTGFVVFMEGDQIRAGLRQNGAGYIIRFTNFVDSVMTHVAVTFDNSTSGGEIKIYLDAVEQTPLAATADTKSGSGNFATQVLNIGSRNKGAVDFYDGVIDDIRVYSGILNSSQITAIKNDPK
jgi:hypothetical protein